MKHLIHYCMKRGEMSLGVKSIRVVRRLVRLSGITGEMLSSHDADTHPLPPHLTVPLTHSPTVSPRARQLKTWSSLCQSIETSIDVLTGLSGQVLVLSDMYIRDNNGNWPPLGPVCKEFKKYMSVCVSVCLLTHTHPKSWGWRMSSIMYPMQIYIKQIISNHTYRNFNDVRLANNFFWTSKSLFLFNFKVSNAVKLSKHPTSKLRILLLLKCLGK